MSELHLLTEEDLKKLPRWARVAFAARCARRVQAFANIQIDRINILIDKAISISEEYSGNTVTAAVNTNSDTAALAAAFVVDAYDEMISISIPSTACLDAASAAANSAAFAARLSAYDTKSITRKDIFNDSLVGCTYDAVSAYTNFIGDDVSMNHDKSVQPMIFDYQLLLETSKKENWNNDTPVHPGFFGLLWPFGEPEDWPEKDETSEGYKLQLEIDIPDGLSDDEVDEYVWGMVRQANRLHRAYGGNGLEISGIKILKEVEEPVPQEVG